jgi:hypothetical protein
VTPGYPHHVTVDLGGAHVVSGIQYTRRQNSANGAIDGYEVYTSEDGVTWGTAAATGRFTSTLTAQRATFAPRSAHFVRVVALSQLSGQPWATMAELNVEGSR